MYLKKKIFNKVGSAIADFEMIEEGDSILIALSGGKDSWVLLSVLSELNKRAPIDYKLAAVHVEMKTKKLDLNLMKATTDKNGIPLFIIESEIDEIVTSKLKKNSYCAFCSRLRRGQLYSFAYENGYNKLALGHHRDDFNETLLLNQFFTGQMKSMAAKLKSDDGKNVVIRPLVYVPEEYIIAYNKEMNFPILEAECPYATDSYRKLMKELLNEMEKKIPKIKNSLLASQQRIVKSHLLGMCLEQFEKTYT